MPFRFSSPDEKIPLDNIWLSSGTHGALNLAVNALCQKGDNILVPQPGFSLVRTVAESIGCELRYYDLNPDKNWEIDFESVKKQIDHRTKAFMVINPSNPCGSVFTKEH